MKKYVPLALFIIGLSLVLLYQYQKYRVAPGLDISGLPLENAAGKPATIESTGKKQVICFFATWCGDCLLEMKQLNEVYLRELPGVNIIAISDEDWGKINGFAQRKNYPFTFYRLTKPFHEIDINAIPVTYIMNEKGEITYTKVGALSWKDPSTIAFIKEKLK